MTAMKIPIKASLPALPSERDLCGAKHLIKTKMTSKVVPDSH